MDPSSTAQPVHFDKISIPKSIQSYGQYEYSDFDEVLKWVDHFVKVKGPAPGFTRFVGLREYYINKGMDDRVRSVENLLKNGVGIQRLEEDIPNLRELYLDRTAKFHQGKFLGWQEDVEYDPSLRGVCCFQICSCR